MQRRTLAWRALSLAFAGAAAVHVVAVARGDGPTWRHALFVAVNLGVAAALWTRWRASPAFALAFAVLTAQQLWSHGCDAWRAWTWEARLDVVSIVVVVAMPAVLAAVLRAVVRAPARVE